MIKRPLKILAQELDREVEDIVEYPGELKANLPFASEPSVRSDGSIYHVLMYGINAMGSHAGQVNEEERWQIAQYVMKLREESKK